MIYVKYLVFILSLNSLFQYKNNLDLTGGPRDESRHETEQDADGQTTQRHRQEGHTAKHTVNHGNLEKQGQVWGHGQS